MARASETVRPLAHDLHAHEPVGEKRRTGPSVRATAIGTDRADQDRSILDRFHFGEGSSRRNGSFKKKGPQAIGKSRGGWNTKIHMVAADDRTAIAFALSPGNDHDAPHGRALLEELGPMPEGLPMLMEPSSVLVADVLTEQIARVGAHRGGGNANIDGGWR